MHICNKYRNMMGCPKTSLISRSLTLHYHDDQSQIDHNIHVIKLIKEASTVQSLFNTSCYNTDLDITCVRVMLQLTIFYLGIQTNYFLAIPL